MPITVKIYCHHRLLAEGLCQLVKSEEEFIIVGTCSQAEEFEAVRKKDADIVIADMDAFLEFNRSLSSQKKSKVLIVWESWRRHPATENLSKLISEGVSGILFPETTVAVLKKSIKSVASGELWLNRKLLEEMIIFREHERPTLSKQERRVVSLVCQGCRNKEIAQKLGITEQTVKSHCNRIYKKLGITDRLQLALHGYRNGETTEDF